MSGAWKAAALAGVVVLAGSADWAIEPAGICAVDRRSCELALHAYRAGSVFRDLAPRIMGSCLPMPGCRAEREDYIGGYNLPERLR